MLGSVVFRMILFPMLFFILFVRGILRSSLTFWMTDKSRMQLWHPQSSQSICWPSLVLNFLLDLLGGLGILYLFFLLWRSVNSDASVSGISPVSVFPYTPSSESSSNSYRKAMWKALTTHGTNSSC